MSSYSSILQSRQSFRTKSSEYSTTLRYTRIRVPSLLMVARHNGDRHDPLYMILYMRSYHPVTSGQQVAGVLVSLLGLSTTVLVASSESPFIITFWYFPKTRSVTEVSVRDGSSVQRKLHGIVSPGFLKTEETQLRQHASGYMSYFKTMGKFYEKRLKSARQKELATKK